MKYTFLQKAFTSIIIILSPIFISLPVWADSGSSSGGGWASGGSISIGYVYPVTTEVISISTKESGTEVNQLIVNTRLTVNKENLPELKEYICIFGNDNKLKAVAISNIKIDENKQTMQIIGSFNIANDYIKIFVWDDNMKPYNKGINMYLKDIPRSIPSPSHGGGGSVGITK